ncbi:MAG: ATP-dependent DNA helicase RecG [Bacteroidota bacterium]
MNRTSPPKQSSARTESPLQYVKGIGPKRASVLPEFGIRTIRDLLTYFPFDYLDRSRILPIGDLKKHLNTDKPVTVIGEVFRQEIRRARRTNRLMFFLTIKDESDFLTCVWFEGVQWYKDAFEVGELLAVSAYPEVDKLRRVQFIHPEFDRLKGATEEDEPDWGAMFNTGAIIPKYRSNAELAKVGLDSRGFRRIIRNALQTHLRGVEETLSRDILLRHDLKERGFALAQVHFPANSANLEAARRRLKFDELFFLQLMLAYRKRAFGGEGNGIAFSAGGGLARRLTGTLPYTLTKAQRKVIREIVEDMKSSKSMNRLLQGDVGSGKTIVSLLAMLMAVESGYQVAMMAPTEILADQHYRTLTAYLKDLPVNVRLLVGGQRKKLREDVLEDIRSGRANITVGTHAVIEESVGFERLGLVVIDEQHRFGVMQRATLRGKGYRPDVLVMTATPIPRTLALTLYGDLDVSVIDELPAHRKPIKTAVRAENQTERVYHFVREEVARGRQAYVVFPLIEESEKVDLKAATAEFKRLQKEVFPGFQLGLLHGRMKSDEKDAVMLQFQAGQIQILVATTVIEVGIDIPNATIMIIENAERFGLSQLHQLRGRVGRGADQSYCILIADYGWFDAHRKGKGVRELQQERHDASLRLETMVETTDGFRIAEVDLELRGPGEFFGTRQSGLPQFKIADLVTDKDLMAQARSEAFALVAKDPDLRDQAHAPIRNHFEKEYKEALRLGDVG